MSNTTALIESIVDGIKEQIDDLGPDFRSRVRLDAFVTSLEYFVAMVKVEPQATQDVAAAALAKAKEVQAGLLDGTKGLEDLGALVGRLDTLGALVTGAARVLLTTLSAQLGILSHRPDVEAILGDLEAIKSLRGGPADATAFHDLHVLQLAFKSVWIHAFDSNLKAVAEQASSRRHRIQT